MIEERAIHLKVDGLAEAPNPGSRADGTANGAAPPLTASPFGVGCLGCEERSS